MSILITWPFPCSSYVAQPAFNPGYWVSEPTCYVKAIPSSCEVSFWATLFKMTLVLTTFSLMPVTCFAPADRRHERTEPGCPSTMGSLQRTVIAFMNKYTHKCDFILDSPGSSQKPVFQHRSRSRSGHTPVLALKTGLCLSPLLSTSSTSDFNP